MVKVAMVVLSLFVWVKWKAEYAAVDPALQRWYESQRNQEGMTCCAESDAHDYYGDISIQPDGGVLLDGDHLIPPSKVLRGPNPTGHAVWWYVENSYGHTDYCFALPSLG